MSRAYTVEEMRKMFLNHLRAMRDYWENEARAPTVHEKLDGLCFSFLTALDGCSSLPAMDLVPSPHPDDKEYHQDNGDNWWEPVVINDGVHLHDMWGK